MHSVLNVTFHCHLKKMRYILKKDIVMLPIEIVSTALAMAQNRLQAAPDFQIYRSIALQLEYMQKVLQGKEDKSRMKDIIVGLYAAKEFEESDPEFADALYHASNIADKMARGLKIT